MKHVIASSDSVVQLAIQIKNGIMIQCHCTCKKYQSCKKDYSWNPSICICDNSRYLKCIVDESVIVCDEIVNVKDSASTNVTNTLSTNETNVTSTVPINSDDNIVRYKMNCYILHTFLLMIILLYIIAIM